jgi:carbamoyl-phosphate synthase large subunit
MPKDSRIKKVLVIGSGPIIIGQAAEFDYAGTQACRALRAEGIEVVLVNSNPATIMTDKEMADRVYLEPINIPTLKKIILKEKPDSILPTLGGQTGLNLACELAESGFLDEQGVRLLGTAVDTIRKAEDRELFKKTMQEIGEPVIESAIVHTVEEAVAFASSIGYPVIVRPAYTLGGTGGGNANNEKELREIAAGGLKASRIGQCLIEKSVAGYKEIEYEVIRDNIGNCIIVCNMENVDPVGVHTGDSIVVAPSQTLNDKEYQMLRSSSINIINALDIKGGCNVQFALDTDSMDYYLIEVNPRVSRSSALASKATGYPIAKVASLIAIGYNLDEIKNGVTGQTYACFEPTIDYVVCKFPRWPFDKFTQANRLLGTRMKATGEVMSIGSNFEQSFLKALRSLELGYYSTESKKYMAMSNEEIKESLKILNDERIFCICEALRRGVTPQYIGEITKIDLWFLNKLKNITDNEEYIKANKLSCLTKEYLRKVKKHGFSDFAIAKWCGVSEDEIKKLRLSYGIKPAFNMVDTCGAEFKAVSPYFYTTYQEESEFEDEGGDNTIVVLGSGPIRIGQGIEFDYCSVHCIWALKKAGYKAVIINNNPETVSTDFDTSDRLYFEPLTKEEVGNILEAEKPKGVIVQFGGQTAIKLAKAVADMGYRILGTQLSDIDAAEDRELFDNLLGKLKIKRPEGATCFTAEEAINVANKFGYPVLVRPSYVLGGQGMEIAYNDKNIRDFMDIINVNTQEHPVLVDKYIMGKELEVDAICDGEDILIPGIMEHIERTGVHSGDSISVYPDISLDQSAIEKIIDITRQLALALNTKGLINIQYILKDGELYVIEVNPRSSRTVPYISKVTGVPMVKLATHCSLGAKLRDLGYGTGLYRRANVYAVKVPVFSNEKIPSLEISLSPEMKSTGEVLGLSGNFSEALLKGLIASNLKMKKEGAVLISVSDGYKQETMRTAFEFSRLGFEIYATSGTANVLNQNSIAANVVNKISGGSDDIPNLLKSGKVSYIINTPTKGRNPQRDGFKIRRLAVEMGIPCFTSIDTANAVVYCIKNNIHEEELQVTCLQDIV